MDKDLKLMDRQQLERLVVALEQPEYLARYIFSFIHAKDVCEISNITPLSKALRTRLVEQGYYISRLETTAKFSDPDGTIKYVFACRDGRRIESVLLSDDDRTTLCASTQVGCAMDCAFCATGRLGFMRNLSTAEITDQVVRVEADGHSIDNLVFMGMGEPMLNYDAVLQAVRILNDSDGRNIGARRITISTCGIPDGIRRLADEGLQVRLAISLNAPTDAIRAKLMPIAKKYPLKKVLSTVRDYQAQTRRRVTFEYVLMKGLNDKVIHAQLVCKLLSGLMCNINLIEYNPHAGCKFEPSGREAIARFTSVLQDAGFEATVRFRKGRSIRAACGQLGADWLKE